MNDKTLAGFSKESPAPRYVVYHLAGGYRRKQKWHVCDSADLRHTNPPPVIAVCYEEEHAERIIEALNESFSPETGELQRLRGLLEAIAAREPEARRAVAAGEYNTTFAIDLASMARLGLEGTLYGHAQKAGEQQS